MELHIGFKEQRSQNGDKDAAECTAGSNKEVISGQMAGMRAEGIKFPVADHTAAEEQKVVKSDNQRDIRPFFFNNAGDDDA